jgi:CubicO group peptidase (beta-lactamase class C family)
MPASPLPALNPGDLARQLREQRVAPDVAAGCSVKRVAGWRSDMGGDTETYFDLASLTKPMTAVAVARSSLARTDRLAGLCPELGATKSAEAPLELLLSHRAGLTAHIPIFHPLVSGGTIDASAALHTAADARRDDAQGDYPPGGFAPVYSDLGYALAGHALARHTGTRDAGEAILRLVVHVLGLEAQLGTARDLDLAGQRDELRVAPTEDVAWRGGLVRGVVHDENAWALTGLGGSGHAGMFGTVTAVLRFGEAVLDGLEGEGPFAGTDLAWLVAPRPGGTLRAGFDGKSVTGSSAGERFGARSFGHLGFTGTSLWIDPDARIVAALLTNRVSPSRANEALKKARPFAHDALHAHASALGV